MTSFGKIFLPLLCVALSGSLLIHHVSFGEEEMTIQLGESERRPYYDPEANRFIYRAPRYKQYHYQFPYIDINVGYDESIASMREHLPENLNRYFWSRPF